MKESVIKKVIAAIVAVLLVGFGTAGTVTIVTREDGSVEIKTETVIENSNATVEYAEEQIPAQIDETILETDEGNIVVDDVPTVEAVDGGIVEDCPEGSEECAKGAVLPPLDITSPYTFYNSVIDQCIDFDGAYGSQCYDEFAYFHYVYTGHWLSTNGTGAAYGIWDARDYNNPINPETGETYYELITDPTQVRPGDFVVFYGGRYGHTGDAMGYYNNGYVALLGTNQGGRACAGGGSAANVINISMSNFRGAFRPRIWIPKPEPTPTPADNCDVIEVKAGDTLGEIMERCEGKVEYGEVMNEYARHWKSTRYMLYPTVFDGWASEGGYGLFAGDRIERIK